MDSTQPQAATSSSTPIHAHTEDPSQPGTSEPKVLRTSARVKAAKQKEKEIAQSPESIGMGPGRTGVKGVIRDRDEAAEIQREQRAREAEEMRRKFEAANLGGKTFLEEEREKGKGK